LLHSDWSAALLEFVLLKLGRNKKIVSSRDRDDEEKNKIFFSSSFRPLERGLLSTGWLNARELDYQLKAW
jgi:hypothetical protein